MHFAACLKDNTVTTDIIWYRINNGKLGRRDVFRLGYE